MLPKNPDFPDGQRKVRFPAHFLKIGDSFPQEACYRMSSNIIEYHRISSSPMLKGTCSILDSPQKKYHLWLVLAEIAQWFQWFLPAPAGQPLVSPHDFQRSSCTCEIRAKCPVSLKPWTTSLAGWWGWRDLVTTRMGKTRHQLPGTSLDWKKRDLFLKNQAS